jgi:hypothetical protein
MEKWIKKWQPDLCMLDYRVSYENQKKFSQHKTVKKGSAARIFTNLAGGGAIPLPSDQGYKYCSKCDRYSYLENLHCDVCNSCPSKVKTAMQLFQLFSRFCIFLFI